MSFFGKKPLKTIAPLETAKTVYADFDTTLGKFRVQLFVDRAPQTVTNFIQLAEGTVAATIPSRQASKQETRRTFMSIRLPGIRRPRTRFMTAGPSAVGDEGSSTTSCRHACDLCAVRAADHASVRTVPDANRTMRART